MAPNSQGGNVEPIEIPINGVLDLHTFNPKEVKPLLCDYIAACREKEIYSLRIIHGKGTGVLKKRVQQILENHPDVFAVKDAPLNAGGWGATLAELKRIDR